MSFGSPAGDPHLSNQVPSVKVYSPFKNGRFIVTMNFEVSPGSNFIDSDQSKFTFIKLFIESLTLNKEIVLFQGPLEMFLITTSTMTISFEDPQNQSGEIDMIEHTESRSASALNSIFTRSFSEIPGTQSYQIEDVRALMISGWIFTWRRMSSI